MNLQIRSIKYKGDLTNERIVFVATADCALGDFMVFKTRKNGVSSISSLLQKTFWFPDRTVNKGDLVVLYTKAGPSSSKQNDSGNSSHFFYWAANSALWKEDEDAVGVLEIRGWDHKAVRDAAV